MIRPWLVAGALGSAVTALLCGLAGCASDAPPQQPPLGSIPTEDLIYESRSAGFTLGFPPSWHDRYDVDARSGPLAAAQWPLSTNVFQFVYRAVEPDQPPAVVLTLLVYHRADWNTLAAEPGSAPGVLVGERADDVYVAAVARSNPLEAGSRDAAYFEAMRLSPEQVKDALTIH